MCVGGRMVRVILVEWRGVCGWGGGVESRGFGGRGALVAFDGFSFGCCMMFS